MNTALVDSIARAVLYEGYLLYPYRPSTVKNRQRFNFGVVYPQSYSEAQGGTESCAMQTECLLSAGESADCTVRVRFLRLIDRTIQQFDDAVDGIDTLDTLKTRRVERLEVAGKLYQAWQEAAEEEIKLTDLALSSLLSQPMQWPFRVSAKRQIESIKDEAGMTYGFVTRERKSLAATIEVSAERLSKQLFRLAIRLQNTTAFVNSAQSNRENALAHSLVSAHTIVQSTNGEFISLVDPPENLREFAMSCKNVGTWPVLAGEQGRHDTILSSPIILYDYPQVAAESPGDLFDGAEIDEILSLRILTMTDEEKREMRQSDERARQILERTESLPEEQLMKLHGAIRGLRPVNGERP